MAQTPTHSGSCLLLSLARRHPGSSGCPGHPTYQPPRLLRPLPGTLHPARGPGNPCSSFRLQLHWPSQGSCPWVSHQVRPSCYMLPEYPAVLLGTLTIIHVFVMVSLLPIILRGQGCGRITHPSPGSDAEQWAFRKYLLTEDHCEQSWDPASRMMATEMTRRAGEMQICKSVLGPLQTESSSIGSQQSMDGTKSGLVPDWVNAVLLEESHSQSLQCCV